MIQLNTHKVKCCRLLLAAFFLLIISATGKAETFELTMASSHPTTLPWVGVLSSHVVKNTNSRLEKMGSEDRVEWIESYGGALFGYKNTLEAVEDGITDAGWVGTLWEESKMPYQSITYYTPFVIDSLPTLMNIMNDLQVNVPEFSRAWEKRNMVFLGSSGVETYHLVTNFPVNSIDDLKGRKIIAPGPSGNWINALGAVPVNGALPTYYNQIQTGIADGVVTIITGYYANKLYEVAPYVTKIGLGSQFLGAFAINRDSWNKLSDDVRQVLSELGTEYSHIHAEEVERRYHNYLAELAKIPEVDIHELSASEKQRWISNLPNIVGVWADHLDGGSRVLDTYMQAVRDAGVTPGRDWDKE